MSNTPRLRLVDTSATAYQFHVLLHGVNPPVWRRILMRSDHTLADLHFAIQLAIGWSDEHLHVFKIRGKEYSVPRAYGIGHRDAGLHRLKDFSFRPGERFIYEYDFTDWWKLQIRFEKEFALEEGKTYPRCISGSRAAPPEDCGGPWAYMELMDEHRLNFPWEDVRFLCDGVKRVLEEKGKDARAAIGDMETFREAVERVHEYHEFRPERFDRRKSNRRLGFYAQGDKRRMWE